MTDHITIGDTAPRIQYTGDGAQTDFSYPFAIFADADLEVFLGDTLQAAGYSVAGAGASSGGTVTFATAPADGTTVTLRRRITVARTTDFQEGGAFRAKTINDELDRLIAIAQEIRDDLGRALQLAPTDPNAALELPDAADRAGNYLAFDQSGALIAAAAPAGETAVTPFMATVLDDTDAAAARATLGAIGSTDSGAGLAATGHKATTPLARTAAYTVAAADAGKVVECSGNFTLSLTAAAALGANWTCFVRNTGTRLVTIDPDGAETIDSAAAIGLWPRQSCMIYCDGAGFQTIGRPSLWEIASPTTLYVDATDGDDSNDGLAPGPGNALASIQAAVNLLANFIINDDLTIQLNDDMHAGNISLVPWLGNGTVTLRGNTSMPTNCLIGGGGDCIKAEIEGANYQIEGVHLSAGSNACVSMFRGTRITFTGKCRFESADICINIVGAGCVCRLDSDFETKGAMNRFAAVHFNAVLLIGQGTPHTWTLVATTSWAWQGIHCIAGGVCHVNGSTTIVGTATGSRYDLARNGVIETFGAGVGFLPGSSGGTVGTGGQYG